MPTKPLSIDLPRIDGDTQSRLSINQDVVDDYADMIAERTKWPFPPLDVFHDGTDYFVADGFHRFLAAKRAERGSVPCNIHQGTAKDARIFGMTANDQHGLRMSRADKRACVEWLLDNGGKMVQSEIAAKAGVTTRFVKKIVAERNAGSISGKGKPHQRHGKGNSSPYTPSRGGKPDPAPEPPPEKPDLGKCPNCGKSKWDEDEDGYSCAKCHHPHGEPVGDPDDGEVKKQRQKTVKACEALMRAFCDLNRLSSNRAHKGCIESCKGLLKIAKEWT